ncbi:MAG: GDP-mannose 4,6-dehydratase [Pseudomonadota bacterium]
MKKRALSTGISGQDGSYLAELLLEEGYAVHGLVQRVELEDPTNRLWRINHLNGKLKLHEGSIESHSNVLDAVTKSSPCECYHLAAQSFVNYSFDDAHSIINSDIRGTHNVLSALKEKAPECRYYFAASSEMFGAPESSPQDEQTRFLPRSPYGIAKLAGYHLSRNYRESYGIHATSGILYNHESPRRGFEFVTRKITSQAARIKMGQADMLALGNMDAVRDWGYAKDYVRAMHMMLQQDQGDDYVVATGVTHSVRQFVQLTFEILGLDYRKHVKQDERFFRPAEKVVLIGNAEKAKEKLGWTPTMSFVELVQEMVRADYDRLYKGA